jgi:hypothetical protein
MMPLGIEPVIEDLLVVLDSEARLLETKRSQLAELSKKLLANDNEAVEVLLEKIERAEEAQTLLARRLQTLRETLAGAFGCDISDFNLAWLIARLPRSESLALTRKRRAVGEKVDAFRKQHLQTTILLTECSRITGMMLDRLAPAGAVVTYDADGSDRWRADAGMLDMER